MRPNNQWTVAWEILLIAVRSNLCHKETLKHGRELNLESQNSGMLFEMKKTVYCIIIGQQLCVTYIVFIDDTAEL